jgi:pimeloyl-ACP methyl ester carboxylesterase
MTSSPGPEGPGSVSGAPDLPAGFAGTFASWYVDARELRLHAVTGGAGPPLLLVPGWPQFWYQFRLIMPALGRDFCVVAVDQRGVGLSGIPRGGYDTATWAGDLAAVMDALGRRRFAVYGTDVGMPVGYALAADHRDRVDRLAVCEAPLPGISASPPLFLPAPLNAMLWHLAFNQLPGINEQLVTGREEIFFGAEFDAPAGTHKLPGEVVRYYIDAPQGPRPAARQLRVLPRDPGQQHPEPAAPDPAADPAGAGDRRRGKRRGRARDHDEAGRGRRADPGHPRLRPPGRRAGSRPAARRAHHVPGPVPGRHGRGARLTAGP